MRVALCVYSCNRQPYIDLRQQLLQEPWMQELMADPAVTAYFVFADPTIREAQLDGSDLRLPCEDTYNALTEKTVAMMRFFNQRGGFDFLIKLDDSIAANSAILRMRRTHALGLCRSHYSGCDARFSMTRTRRKWAQKKGISIDGDPYPRFAWFYTGKCYVLSRKAVAVVAEKSAEHLPFVRSVGYMEDVFVARILQRYLLALPDRLRSLGDIFRTKFRDFRFSKWNINTRRPQ